MFDKVNEKVGDLINGMPNEVNIGVLISQDPYNNETSSLLHNRKYSSLNQKKVEYKGRQWSDIKVRGVSNRYQDGMNPNKMDTFSYVDKMSCSNEKILQMRAALLDNREGYINGKMTSQPS